MMVAGFGCRTGASTASLRAAFDLAQGDGLPVTHLATLADKAHQLTELSALLCLPLIMVRANAIIDLPTPTRSDAAMAARGTGSVAEACALAAAGPGAGLLVRRRVSPDRTATCAIAHGVAS